MGNRNSHTKKSDNNVTSMKSSKRRKGMLEGSSLFVSVSSSSITVYSDASHDATVYEQFSPVSTSSVVNLYTEHQEIEASDDENYQLPTITYLPQDIRANQFKCHDEESSSSTPSSQSVVDIYLHRQDTEKSDDDENYQPPTIIYQVQNTRSSKSKPRILPVDLPTFDLRGFENYEEAEEDEKASATDSQIEITHTNIEDSVVEDNVVEDEEEYDEERNEEEEIPEVFNWSPGDDLATLSSHELFNDVNENIMSPPTTSTKSKSPKPSDWHIVRENVPSTKMSSRDKPRDTQSAPVSSNPPPKNVPPRNTASRSTKMAANPPSNESNPLSPPSTPENDETDQCEDEDEEPSPSNTPPLKNHCEEKKPRNVARTGATAPVRSSYCGRSRLTWPPPVYIPTSGSGGGGCGGEPFSGGRKTRNPIDRLQNVDVIESLCYYNSPKGEIGCGGEAAGAMDMYSVCDDCGAVEYLGEKKEKKVSHQQQQPVTYTRKQRFNFKNRNDDLPRISAFPVEDGPPYVWPSVANPRCPPHRVSSFDEIPVGKNPGPNCKCLQKMFRGRSGNYVYDAKKCRLRRKEDVDAEKIKIVVEDECQPMPCDLCQEDGRQNRHSQVEAMSCDDQYVLTPTSPTGNGSEEIQTEETNKAALEKAPLCELLIKMLANCMVANNNTGNPNGNWLNCNPPMNMGQIPGYGNGIYGPCDPYNGMLQSPMMPPMNNCQAYYQPKKHKKHKKREGRTPKKKKEEQDSEDTLEKHYDYNDNYAVLKDDDSDNEYEMIEVIEV